LGYTGDKKRAYQLEWMRARRSAWIEENGPCAHCGSTEDLEVDHIDPSTKEFTPAAIWSRSAGVRESELAKCQVLCQSCHAVKTHDQLYKGHGCESRYKEGCRCSDCRRAHTERARRYRSR